MGSQILVNSSQFDIARNHLLTSYLNIAIALQKMQTTNTNLSSNWEGQSGSAFFALAQDLEQSFLENNSQLKEMISQMDMAEKGFTDLDNDIKDQINRAGR